MAYPISNGMALSVCCDNNGVPGDESDLQLLEMKCKKGHCIKAIRFTASMFNNMLFIVSDCVIRVFPTG